MYSRRATNSSTAMSSAAELARYFPAPILSAVGERGGGDGAWVFEAGRPRPLALFDACARRLFLAAARALHTGTDWRAIQPWILLTNYQHYVDQFVRWALDELVTACQPLPTAGIARRW